MKATTDAETKAVTAFLQTIVETHERLHELARQLRSCSEVKAVKVYPFAPGDMTQHHWDEEQQKKAFGSDFGVSAELHDGAVLDWWLEVRCEESGWHIAANIFRSDVDEDGCHKVVESGEHHSPTLAVALKQASEAVASLVASERVPQLLLSCCLPPDEIRGTLNVQ